MACGHGDVCLFESACRARAECPKVIGTRENVGDGKAAARSGFDPELVGQVLLLEIYSVIDRGQPDPNAHRRGARIVGVIDGEGAAHSASATDLGIGGPGHARHRLGIEPSVGPRALFGGGLGLGVSPKGPRLQGNGIAGGTRVFVSVNENGAEGLRDEAASWLVLGETKTVVPTPEHIQQRVADVLGELPMHGSAIIILVAGYGLPNAVGCARGSPTPDVELSQRIAVGVFAFR